MYGRGSERVGMVIDSEFERFLHIRSVLVLLCIQIALIFLIVSNDLVTRMIKGLCATVSTKCISCSSYM